MVKSPDTQQTVYFSLEKGFSIINHCVKVANRGVW